MLRSAFRLLLLLCIATAATALPAFAEEGGDEGSVAGGCAAPMIGPGPTYQMPMVGGPVAIPDNTPGGTSLCMTIPFGAGGTIGRFEVGLGISHTFVGDLIVNLDHNGAPYVTLLNRPGSPMTPLGCSGNVVDAVFSDDAPVNAEDMCNAMPPAISGNVRPAGTLNNFLGDRIDGLWTLFVSDNQNLDTGAVNHWSLDPIFYGDVNCADSINSIDALLVLQLVGGLLQNLPCQDMADVSIPENGVDAIDALLILQFVAGLINELPPV